MKSKNAINTAMVDRYEVYAEYIQSISLMIGIRDPYTAEHQDYVASLAVAIGGKMGLSDYQIKGIELAAKVHDVGKICIPTEILAKPGNINSIERSLIHQHPQVGYDILSKIHFPWPIAEIVLQHHERMDGSGYPDGLTEREILLESKIIGVADVVVAMSSHRPYRPAKGIGQALHEISSNKGILYDSDVVDACLEICKDCTRLAEIC